MAASASKRAKEDDRRKKEKMQEEKEVAKSLQEETAKKKENEEAKKKDNNPINGSDNDSVMSNVTSIKILTDPTAYSKDELVEMLKNARISRRSSVKGSAPKENGKTHHKSSDNGGSFSENDDSDLSLISCCVIYKVM